MHIVDRANLEGLILFNPFLMGGLGLNDYKIKIEILTIMHAWCECTHDHEMNENNEVNEEGRDCDA